MAGEKALIEKAKDGDREALNSLILQYWQPVYRLIYNKLGNEEDAKELTQDTFMKALRALPQYKVGDTAFKAYLGRVASNLVIDFWRKQGRTPGIADIADYQEVLSDSAEKPEDYALRFERQQEIAGLVDSLPDEQRQTIRLRVILGLSVKDAALMMDKTEAAVKMLQQRALKNLRRLYLNVNLAE
ncbi:RNA polymerase sigma factor [Propionispora sp. 2/2-37]|uniref:RNA polymerase sigma factor n=1 Tax=Propionispora sp. 2/2-37 TaxID=1677858 RepID=UPI0006BB5CC9|nr:RNA polymerase sigma factor [Propionispora sp. 2/2-37]